MSTTRSSLVIKINCPVPILFFSRRVGRDDGHDRRRDEKINLGFEILFFHRDVGRVVLQVDDTTPLRGCLTPSAGVA